MIRSLGGATVAAMLLWAALRVDARLAWLVCAPLVAASPRGGRTRGPAIMLGATFALEVALAGHAEWLSEAAARYFSLPQGTALVIAVALCVVCAVPMGALLGLLLRSAAALTGARSIAASAAVWVAWEQLTRISFPSYPWVGLAATQTEVPSVLQLASVMGQGGLSLVMAASGSAVGHALRPHVRAASDGPPSSRHTWPQILFATALALATPLFGAARLRSASSATAPLCSLAGVDADIRDPSIPAAQILERYAGVGERGAAKRPDAIVWPESALPGDPLLDPDLLRRLRGLSETWHTVLVVGGPRSEWGPDWRQRRYNSVFRIAQSEPVVAYDKRAPVPFAESWPPLLPRPPRFEVVEIARGGPARTMRVGGCEIGVLVCFEAERAAFARELARGGADAIVVLSNDAVLPARAVAAEVSEARLRALETGLPVLRVSNGGASLAIDRYGREVGRQTDGVVTMRVVAPELAPAVRWSTTLLSVCWATVIATVITAYRAERRR